jgi:hypothetical protein
MSRSALAAAREAYRLAAEKVATTRAARDAHPSGPLPPLAHVARLEARLAHARAEEDAESIGRELAKLLDHAEPRLDPSPLKALVAQVAEAEKALQAAHDAAHAEARRIASSCRDVMAERKSAGLPKPNISELANAVTWHQAREVYRGGDHRTSRSPLAVMLEHELANAKADAAREEIKKREAAAREAEARRDIERQRETIAAQDRERNARVAADELRAREALGAEVIKLFPEAP